MKNMMIAFLIIVLIILLLIIFWQLSTIISIFGGIHYVYSGSEIISESLKIAKAEKGDVFYELGSGFGNGLIIASEKFGLKSVGIEISPFHYLISKLKTLGNKNINIFFSDARKADFSPASVVYCYLSVKLMAKLSSKFQKELKPGAIVISNSFMINKLKPYLIKEIAGKKMYFYKL